MKRTLILSIAAGLFLVMVSSFQKNEDVLKGAFQIKNGNEEQVLIFADGYFTHTVYNQQGKQFVYTRGGTFTLNDDALEVQYEFDTRDKEQVGLTKTYKIEVEEEEIEFDLNGKKEEWVRIDNGDSGLSGLWTISARQQEGKIVPIHQTGTRKTIKILSSKRFQWAAIDPGSKQFVGTGGGTYSFEGGKYVENLEFFSRDSSRVGQSLSFDGKLENGEWHHSGSSSRGTPIYEVWSRKNK